MMHKSLIAFLLYFIVSGFSAVFAEQIPTRHVLLKNDSSILDLRKFDLQKLHEYKLQKQFIYDDVAPVSITLWDRFWMWFWGLIEDVVSNKFSGGIIKYVVIALLVILVGYVAFKFIGVDFKIFAGKSKAVAVPYSEALDNIHEINFNEEIDHAIASGNYRLAVRLFYLHSLKLLNDKSLIDWQPEKTNQTYLNEINDLEKRRQFGLLTRQFEYIWYGEFFIDKDDFSQVKEQFEEFNLKTS